MPVTRFTYLAEQHMKGSLSQAETEELYLLATREEYKPALEKVISAYWAAEPGDHDTTAPDLLWDKITAQTMAAPTIAGRRRTGRIGRYWLAAASVALLITAGAYWWYSQPQAGKAAPVGPVASNLPATLQPAKTGVQLILSNGHTLQLDSLPHGPVATQPGATAYLEEGALRYDPNDAPGAAVLYHTIATAKGRQFALTLPDGSQVWLNAASSIRYPLVFDKAKRVVEVTGEAYFEVTHRPHQPFTVQAGQTAISVLGTHFNVKAYEDEQEQQTTLLSGAVQVEKGGHRQLLAPGQQAVVTQQHITVNQAADLDKVMAWKTGLFVFSNSDIKMIMREIARWYDIEVVYRITDLSGKYGGTISRKSTLPELKMLLEGNGVYHYQIEGKKLIVLP